MVVTINKNSVYKTIGHNQNFTPVLIFKIGQRKQAIKDLTNYFNEFSRFLATGVDLTSEELSK